MRYHTKLIATLALTALATGCSTLRFAPGETQKQNTYLHHRTVQAAAIRAQTENSSETLRQLTTQATRQSDAIVAYYGLPQQLPATESIDDILDPAHQDLTEQARNVAMERPDPWDVADSLMELGIALAGVVGGVYGMRAVGALQTARQKSTALREIVRGNELFKQTNPDFADSFKKSHQVQTETTRTLVAAMK